MMKTLEVTKPNDKRHFVKDDFLKMSQPIDDKSLSSIFSSQFLFLFINDNLGIYEIYDNALRKSKYVKSIILSLSNGEPISHDNLAKLNHLHKSQLTRSLSEIAPFDFIAYDRLGNTKNYYLTNKGDNFASYLKKEKSAKSAKSFSSDPINGFYLCSDYKKE